MTAHHADIAKALVEDPDRYGEFRHRFSPEFEYYRQVRNAATQTLTTFEEFLQLHEVFFEQSHGDTIKSWVEQNLARSLKNMVLETSPRGQAYPLSTLADVQTRLEAYSRIGVDTPTLGVVVDTIVEALFDSEGTQLRPEAREEIAALLSETPRVERISGPLDHLARLKAAQSLASGRLSGSEPSRREELEMAAREYHAATECPSAPEGANACIAAANGIPPGNTEKRQLLAAAVHQEPASIEAMWELFYWSARATVERFRHRNERPTLSTSQSTAS
jgi:hypothetical protein